jgi:hypothetical protein
MPHRSHSNSLTLGATKMNLDNETVNHLIRRGFAKPTFSALPKMSSWFDESGAIKPGLDKLPLVTGMELLIETAISLHPDAVHPPHLVGIQISTETLSKVILTLVRGTPLQPELDDDPKATKRQIDKEISDAIGAHKVAAKVLSELDDVEKIRATKKEKFTFADEYTMDKFVTALKSSPHPEFTKTLLSTSGPDAIQWTGPKRTLPILETPMKQALMAGKTVLVDAKILYVKEKQGVAFIEIDSPANDYSKTVLCHYNAEVELKFDLTSTEGDDLLLLQLRKEKGFFINFTGIFRLLRDNPVIQYFQLEHERYRAV